ncbi:MAG TPA: VanZ family protein, partial [Gemmatimonadaceae bacterium]|nr:VanZ family protein [Gemmatimonadaceae bacterium]
SRSLALLFLPAALAAIALATLTPGEPGPHVFPLTCLVCGPAGGADVARNVLLFLPFGAALALRSTRLRTALALSLALTLLVESAQLWVVPGRDPTLSDVLANTLGGLLGYLIAAHAPLWLQPTRRQARRLVTAGALLWLAQLALTAAGLQWAPPPAPYVENVLPPVGAQMRAFEGELLGRWVDGTPSGTGFGGAAVEAGLARGQLAVRATVRPAYPPGMLRPLVVYFSRAWEPVLVFGQQGRDLVFRARTRSQEAHLGGPTFRLADVFPPLDSLPGGRSSGDDPITVAASVDGPAVRLSGSVRGAAARAATLERRLSLGWAFVVPDLAPARRIGPLLGALWLAGPLLPLAFWARQAAPPGPRGALIGAIATAVGAAAAVWGVSAATGLTVGATETVAAALAILLGIVLGARRRRPAT